MLTFYVRQWFPCKCGVSVGAKCVHTYQVWKGVVEGVEETAPALRLNN